MEFRNNKKAIFWLSTAHFINDIYTGFLNPIMPFIAAKLGFTMALATILIAITQIFSNMLQPIFGFFADNILKRFFIFWGLILVSSFIPLATLAPNIVVLTIFMVLGCLGSSFFHPQSSGFVTFFSSKECISDMSIFISMGSLGFAFGPLLVTFVAQMAGLEKVAYTCILGLFWAFCMFLFVPKLSRTESKPIRKDFFLSFKEILSHRQIDYLLLISMMKSLITSSTSILLPFLWKDLGYSPVYIGSALFLFVFMGALGSFVSSKLEKLYGSKTLIYISLWATCPLMFLFAMAYKTHPVFSIIIFALMGFVTLLAQPVTLVWAQKIMPKYRSIISGFINGFSWGVIAILMSLLGFLAQKFGIINMLIILSFVPPFASCCVKYLKE